MDITVTQSQEGIMDPRINYLWTQERNRSLRRLAERRAERGNDRYATPRRQD